MAYIRSEEIANKHPDWNLSKEKIEIGDVNNNGKIDSGDWVKLLRYKAALDSKEIAEKHSDWLNL